MGCLGQSSGGVNPTGAYIVGTSSVVAAVALMVAKRVANFGDLVGVNEVSLEICLNELTSYRIMFVFGIWMVSLDKEDLVIANENMVFDPPSYLLLQPRVGDLTDIRKTSLDR
ncbi:hypothetical protein Tco_0981733 [Tanacetum coccineum]